MEIGHALLALGEGERAECFETFSRSLDPLWMEQALVATGTATVRRRKLPAEQVVWTLIGMALFRDRSIQEVVHHLHLVLPPAGSRAAGAGITGSGVVQARDRLGSPAVAHLFELAAAHWSGASADAQRWRGLALYGLDGSALRVPDTPENEAAFGRPRGRRGDGAYPQLRLVTLMVLRSHLLAGLSIGPWTSGEVTLAASLWPKLPDRSLTILDRGFLSYGLFYHLRTGGMERHWLIRAKSNLKWRRIKRFGPHDELVELTISRPARRADPGLPETIQVRAIRYQRPGFRPQTLLTSLIEPQAYPATEIVALYHERWEIELGFDEIKTHTLEREEALRSRAPQRVEQEVWGLAIAYNLVRLHMEQAARVAGVTPSRISYRHALLLLRNFWLGAGFVSPGNLPRRLATLSEQLTLLVLPPRRPRRYPRAVKIKMSNYPRKR